MSKVKKKCICEHPYGIEEAIILDRECLIHGEKEKPDVQSRT